MKIFVESRAWIKNQIERNPDWIQGKWIISIFSKDSYSPLPDRFNILKLEFDDVTERDTEDGLLHFSEEHAKQIVDFIKSIKDDGRKVFYVHCDAGVSRSGAVGYLLNEWFNKFLEVRRVDNESFRMNNSHILPNPEVMRILKKELFGNAHTVFVNDYSFNEDGEIINNFKKI